MVYSGGIDMIDERPSLAIRAEFFKYYKRRRDSNLCISANPIAVADTQKHSGWDTCRESNASYLRDAFRKELSNEVAEDNPYIPVPKASASHRLRTITTTGTIKIKTNSIQLFDTFGRKANIDRLSKMLDFIPMI